MEVMEVVMEIIMVVMGVVTVVMVVTLNKLPREAEDNGIRLIKRGEASTIVIHYLAANSICLHLG